MREIKISGSINKKILNLEFYEDSVLVDKKKISSEDSDNLFQFNPDIARHSFTFIQTGIVPKR